MLCPGATAAASSAEEQHLSLVTRATVAAAAVGILVLLHSGCSSLQPTPAPLPIDRLWGCCTQLQLRVWRGARGALLRSAVRCR